jgi:hypothetical protein
MVDFEGFVGTQILHPEATPILHREWRILGGRKGLLNTGTGPGYPVSRKKRWKGLIKKPVNCHV